MPRRHTSMTILALLSILLAGCKYVGPLREYNPENKVNSPSDPHYQPPGEVLINPRTGVPFRPGERQHE